MPTMRIPDRINTQTGRAGVPRYQISFISRGFKYRKMPGHVREPRFAGGHRRSWDKVGLRDSKPTEIPMTDESMNVQAFLGKSADADFLREMIGFAAQRLMDLEWPGRRRLW